MIEKNILNSLENNQIINNISDKIDELQDKFLESKLGKAVNLGLDAGIKAICPNLIEDEVIEIKDALIQNGVKGGINQMVSSIKEFGKNVTQIFTGNFESVSQIEMAVKNGGVIDVLSGAIDLALKSTEEKGLISKELSKTIKKGKNTILKDVSKNISDDLMKEQKSLEKIEEYIGDWKKYYDNKDFENMEKIYKKIEKQINKVLPIKNIIKETETIENIHNLIKNNGTNFDLSENELELAETL